MTELSVRERYRLWLLQHEFVYRNTGEALDDAHRLALLVAVRGAREDRERLRVRTVDALNRARNPRAKRVRGGSTLVDVLFIGAIVVVAIAVALAFVTGAGDLFDRGDGAMIWFGVLALLGIAVLAWCDPMRVRGEVYYSGTSTALFAVLAVLLIGVYALGLFRNVSEIDGYTLPSVLISGLLFVGAAVWALVLWWRGRGAPGGGLLPLGELTEPPEGLLQRLDAGRGLLDRSDGAALYSALDDWWERTAAGAERAHPGRVGEIWRTIVQKVALSATGSNDEQRRVERALSDGMRTEWRERRYDWSPR